MTFGDLRYAFRQLRHRPLFTLTAVLTLAIGMGVNAVAFTVVNGLLFRGSPVGAGGDVGRIVTTPGGDEGGNASIDEYRRFAETTSGALDVAAEGRLSLAWRHDNTTETAYVLFVSPNYFTMVDAAPIAGRVDVSAVPGVQPSVVIGERFWRRKLNGVSPAGLTLRLNGTDVAVAGVLPDSFTGPAGLYSPDVWLPLDGLDAFRTSPLLRRRDARWLFVMGRLAAHVTTAEVQGRLDTAAAAMSREWPETHQDRGARFRLFGDGNSELRGIRIASGIMMGIIGLVLLLACFNVANLLLARAVERERDMGIRAALGAGAGRLMRLAIAEGLLVAVLAGAAAFVLASWTQTIVGSFAIPIDTPQHVELSPDVRVFLFVAALVLVSGVLPGLWPALAAARVDVLRVLGSQGANAVSGRPSRIGRWLVGAQIAGSTLFLAMAALFVQSYSRLSAHDYGLDHDRLTVATFEPASHGYDAARSKQYAEAFLARVKALPGVTGAALADRVPFFIGFENVTAVSATGASCEANGCPRVATMAVGAGYFRTLGVSLAEGHEFAEAGAAAEVVINQPLARLQWPGAANVAGRTMRIGEGDRARTVTVAGVTTKTHTRGLDREQPTLYVPLGDRHFESGLSLAVHAAAAPETLVRPIRDAAAAIDAAVAVTTVETMRARMAVQLWPFRTASWLFSICGGLALVLAASGLAGVVIHAVNRRLREFGVRVSIGATPRDLAVEVLRGSAALLVPGLIAGTLLALVAAHLIRVALVSVNPLNPAVYIGVACLECAIVAAASVGPALRAARVDPLVALRAD